MLLADANDLNMWASRRFAQDQLPRLLRRLIHAIVDKVDLIRFPTDEAVQLGGWDGLVAVSGGNAYVPDGLSVWELGTNRDIKGKADADYEKRCADPLGIDPKQATFIFVTPRRWGNKEEWAAERQKEGVWREVRAYDADDLAAWMELAPTVHIWLSILVGKHPEGASDLTTAWQEWAGATEPPLTPELLTAGRGEAAETVGKWLGGKPAALSLRAETRFEALAFFLAVLYGMAPEDRIAQLARGAVVTDAKAWAQLTASDCPAVLIPMFDDRQAVAHAVRRGHHVLIPLDNADTEVVGAVEVPRVRSEQAMSALVGMGFSEQQAEADAMLVRRSLTAFRRKIAIAPAVHRPAWAQPSEAAAIIPAMLIGAWDDANKADRGVLEGLSGLAYDEYARRLTRWLHEADAPIRRSGNVWLLASKEDAWNLLARYITTDDLQRFERAVTEALTTTDPRVRLSPAERLFLDYQGQGEMPSGLLREGLADTLALMGARNTTLSDGTTSADRALRAVRLIFQKAREWQAWASLSGLLPLLAEASPVAFLDAVEEGISGTEPYLARLFPPPGEENPLFSTPTHTGLLWALETLAWSPSHLGRAVLALARLAALDPTPDSNWINRPHNSLRDIFVCWLPHTAAPLSQRLQVIDLIRAREPDIAWKLLLRLLPTGHEITSSTHTARWREWVLDPIAQAPQAEFAEAVQGVADRIEEDAGKILPRWQEVLNRLGDLPVEQRARLLKRMRSADMATIPAEERTAFWNKVRSVISHIREFANTDWPLTSELLRELEGVYEAFTPTDANARRAWLFGQRPSLLHPPKRKWEERERILSTERLAAVTAAYAEDGLASLRALGAQTEFPQEVGKAAAQAEVLMPDDEASVCEDVLQEDSARRAFARGYVFTRMQIGGWEWADTVLSAREGQMAAPATRAEFYTCLPFAGATWDRVEREAQSVQDCYWSVAGDLWVNDDADCERAMAMLLHHGRPMAALNLAAYRSQGEGRIDPELIVQALQGATHTPWPADVDLQSLGYSVGELLDTLQASGGVPEETLTALEWAYLPLLSHQRGTTVLHGELARNPKLFVEALSLAYRGEGDEEAEQATPTPEEKARASQAYTLLFEWRTVPGMLDGTLDKDALDAWVTDARAKAAEAGRAAIADHLIGKVLSFSPPSEDGMWPCPAVCELIERIANCDLEEGLRVQVYNNRGVVTKSRLEGGIQELSLAGQYRAYAAKTIDRWPRIATVLSEIAEIYEREARRSDLRAELEEDLGR